MKFIGLHTGIKTISGYGKSKNSPRQLSFEVFNKHMVLGNKQDFCCNFVFQVSHGHPVLLEKFNKTFSRNPTLWRPGNAKSLQPAGVKPFVHSLTRYLANFCYLACFKNSHGLLLFSKSFSSFSINHAPGITEIMRLLLLSLQSINTFPFSTLRKSRWLWRLNTNSGPSHLCNLPQTLQGYASEANAHPPFCKIIKPFTSKIPEQLGS